MDPNTGMDPERERRLMTIQMDDLGTARREYLSTYDEEVLPNATIEQIEATRACNQRGTPEYRFQQANKPTLDAWHSESQILHQKSNLG
ncbi:hypothetical protein N7532_011027 [Penicillium argentinense]|uniref:Uncharacterized protein n=1 Tax=Penicillium argentinense TaxID=1131581 RepID=A0A9W9EHQ4_9EURO|nr:uncharacterized protein N7532_011027 [Penicillium argentinense]KAJ5081984.1 hypothetical protein N7532_011027 [Penicillium argentinense]